MKSRSDAVILCSLFLSIAFSAAAPSSPLDGRQLVSDCNSAPKIFNETCWDTLNLTSWLTSWSLPVCKPGQIDCQGDAKNCCEPTENWSNCFLRVAAGVDLFNCTQFNTGSCATPPTSLSNSLDSDTLPEVWYVVKNIFGKHLSPNSDTPKSILANSPFHHQLSTHSSLHGTQPSQPPRLMPALFLKTS